MNTVWGLIKHGESVLAGAGLETPWEDAERLFLSCFNWSKVYYLQSLHEKILNKYAAKMTLYHRYIQERRQWKPIEYILGTVHFHHQEWAVSSDVFIPRPETELLVMKAAEAVRIQLQRFQSVVVLELGIGSGIISLSLAAEFPDIEVLGWDTSLSAYNSAQLNLDSRNMSNVTFLHDDFFECAWAYCQQYLEQGKGVFILSNPPYIPSLDINMLTKDVRSYEPTSALDGGPDGVLFYKKAFHLFDPWPVHILMEIGVHQKRGCQDIVQSLKGNYQTHFYDDIHHIPRVIHISS